MANQPIRRRKLSDEVRDRLLELVNSDRVRPGDPFPSERELMEQFGVGRPAIREAIQSLQAMGLLHVRHGERPRVAEPSLDHLNGQMLQTMRHVLTHDPHSLSELKQGRIMLEVQLVRLAADVRTGDDIANLRTILADQRAVAADPTAFRALDGQFHHAIATISGNRLLSALSAAVFDWMAMFHREMVQSPGLERLTLAEHEAILDAITVADPNAAGRAMGDHLARANSLYASQAKG